jgi:hypothetical protein
VIPIFGASNKKILENKNCVFAPGIFSQNRHFLAKVINHKIDLSSQNELNCFHRIYKK